MIMIAALFSTAAQAKETSPPRIISAGNGITEIIYALGAGDQLIAVDSTSVYPAEVHRLPKLGYHKQLSAEGILAMNPSILVGTDDMGPPATIEQLKGAGLTISALPLQNNADNIQLRIESLAKLLDREQEGKRLWKSVSESLSEARAIAGEQKKPKVLFMLAMGGRTPSVSGSDTSAHALIELAGGVNPAAEQFSSYKPLSNEALLMLAPDVVVFSDQGKGTTPQQLIDMQPILKQTPAGKSGRLIAIDPGMLLGGLGPRTGELAVELAKAFFTSES
ncbi:heme/hemin ABC transporter substrate-binding protein [Endozoicomonas lisbonensis]